MMYNWEVRFYSSATIFRSYDTVIRVQAVRKTTALKKAVALFPQVNTTDGSDSLTAFNEVSIRCLGVAE